jgi:glutathione S-transferase
MHELIYFASPGYAEPTRLCLEISKVPWQNTVVDWDGFQTLKDSGDLPWGYLPILKTPQGTIAESNALMRYAAALAGIEPEDLFVRGKVDEILDLIQGWRADFTPTFMMFSGQFDGIEESMLKPYPALLKYHDFVANDARVKAYYDGADETRWVFKPDAFSGV